MFHYGGCTFHTKTALREHICKAIDYKSRVIGREFFDEVLADLFVDKSYRFKGLRPTAFAYIPNEVGGDRPYGDSLAAKLPELGWRRFSKETLLSDEMSFDKKLAQYCRERFARTWRPLLFTPGPCATTGCSNAGTDLDHIAPQHKDIVAACARLITDDLRNSWAVWVAEVEDTEHFVLPEGHPVTIEYDRATHAAKYQRLCESHHANVSGQRARKNHTQPKKTEVVEDTSLDDLFR